ncbi:MAG TPA: DUF1559 domain-containing protein, partial [Urbifossiella sp.]|nr:DUF1559 domain-containing protein [Urbifossiella sp.]
LLLPAVQKVREAAARTKCVNNLKQMGLALHSYHDTRLYFPSGYYSTGKYQYTGWQLQLLPYLEQAALWTQSDTYLAANPTATDSNAFPAAGFPLPVFTCPSNTRPTTILYSGVTYELTSYMGVSGTSSNSPISGDGVLYCNSQVTMLGITDGTSNTVVVGERPSTGDLYVGWGFSPYGWGAGDGDTVLGSKDTVMATNMGDLSTNVGFVQPRQPTGTAEIDGAHFWSFHTGGGNFLFGDGGVRFMSYSSGNTVFPQLCTRNGGETVALP